MSAKPTKVLFLDFDGVLHRGNSGTFRRLPLLAELLAQLSDVHVVLSTNWRHTESLADLREYFCAATVPRIFDVLPILPQNQRGMRQREIEAWLKGQPQVIAYVALDDSADLFDAGWRGLYLTDPREGLTPDDVQALAKRLQ